VLVAFRNGVYLIETRKTPRRRVPVTETTAALARKLGRALNKPGISREAVFGKTKGRRAVYAYSVHPDDPTKLVRESVDGKCTVGRMIDGKFRAVRTARVANAPVVAPATEPTPEHTARVKAVTTQATTVFGSATRAKQWISRPAVGLNGHRPIDLLQTTQGAELVRGFLTRLEYGVYS
jgi:hypothetical protein